MPISIKRQYLEALIRAIILVYKNTWRVPVAVYGKECTVSIQTIILERSKASILGVLISYLLGGICYVFCFLIRYTHAFPFWWLCYHNVPSHMVVCCVVVCIKLLFFRVELIMFTTTMTIWSSILVVCCDDVARTVYTPHGVAWCAQRLPHVGHMIIIKEALHSTVITASLKWHMRIIA